MLNVSMTVGGWFMPFTAKSNLHNIKVSGESANVDEEAGCAFPETLTRILTRVRILCSAIF